MKAWRAVRRTLGGPAVALGLAYGLCCLLLVLLGESPAILFTSLSNTLFTGFGLGYTLYYMTPLIFTGLSVAIAAHCGLFNIGAEGQLYIGSLAIVCVSLLFPGLPHWLAVPLAMTAAAAAGGAWGGIAGVLKAWRGSHEVIVTILLNFLGLSLVNYFILYPFKNPDTQNTETVALAPGYTLKSLSALGLTAFESTPVNLSLAIAIVLAVFFYFLLFRSVIGFELRTIGENPTAGRFAGISGRRNMILAFLMSGALAGLVGLNDVLGYQGKLVEGFSPGYGFAGIAVALLARNHPMGILLSAFLFGALQNSTREIEFLSEKLSKELAFVLQGLLIALIAGHRFFTDWVSRRRRDA